MQHLIQTSHMLSNSALVSAYIVHQRDLGFKTPAHNPTLTQLRVGASNALATYGNNYEGEFDSIKMDKDEKADYKMLCEYVEGL
jgi:hypothetical protein